jgi:hypothetical protein
MAVSEIVHLVTDGPDWTAIAGIVASGTSALLGAWWNDKRRSKEDKARDERQHDHERALKSGDDLVRLIDEVGGALVNLDDACADMRQLVWSYGVEHPDAALAAKRANDAYQSARVRIAQLGTRPHASEELTTKARTAANNFLEAWKIVHRALVSRTIPNVEIQARADLELANIQAHNEAGIAAIAEYEGAARAAIADLRGSPGRANA